MSNPAGMPDSPSPGKPLTGALAKVYTSNLLVRYIN